MICKFCGYVFSSSNIFDFDRHMEGHRRADEQAEQQRREMHSIGLDLAEQACDRCWESNGER